MDIPEIEEKKEVKNNTDESHTCCASSDKVSNISTTNREPRASILMNCDYIPPIDQNISFLQDIKKVSFGRTYCQLLIDKSIENQTTESFVDAKIKAHTFSNHHTKVVELRDQDEPSSARSSMVKSTNSPDVLSNNKTEKKSGDLMNCEYRKVSSRRDSQHSIVIEESCTLHNLHQSPTKHSRTKSSSKILPLLSLEKKIAENFESSDCSLPLNISLEHKKSIKRTNSNTHKNSICNINKVIIIDLDDHQPIVDSSENSSMKKTISRKASSHPCAMNKESPNNTSLKKSTTHTSLKKSSNNTSLKKTCSRKASNHPSCIKKDSKDNKRRATNPLSFINIFRSTDNRRGTVFPRQKSSVSINNCIRNCLKKNKNRHKST